MALVKDKTRFACMQSWSRWMGVVKKDRRRDLDRELRDAAYLHANLKKREKELTTKNDELIGENGELSGFTTDGKIVTANMKRLKAEVDKLQAQMDEMDADYQEVLDENEKLKQQVAEAERRKTLGKNPKFENLAKLLPEQEN